MKTNKGRKARAWRFPNRETVRQAMERTGINPHRLSQLIEVSPQTACNWRDGHTVRRVYVPLLMRALGVPEATDA